MIRPHLEIDQRYALVAGLTAVVFAAAAVILTLAATRATTQAPTPTTYIVGPDGDNVTISPRSVP